VSIMFALSLGFLC